MNLNKRIRTILIVTILASSLFLNLFQLGKYPLFDWDEATYAHIADNTMRNSDWLALKKLNNNWFEKPPLYIWLIMLSFKVFGMSDFSARLPSALFGVITAVLLFLLVLELSNNHWQAFFASFILILTPPFLILGRQSRVDIPLIAAILFALYSFIKGQRKEKWLLGFGIGVGIGVMIKSVIGLFAFPLALIFSLLYRKRDRLKNKYLWWGLALMVLIVAPWHIYESYRFGMPFWDNYFNFHVLRRITTVMGNSEPYMYLSKLWTLVQPWSTVFVILLPMMLFAGFRKMQENQRLAWFGLSSALFILLVFSIPQTKLWPYLLPMFPFSAIFIATSLFFVFTEVFRLRVRYLTAITVIILVLGLRTTLNEAIIDPYRGIPYAFDEKEVGILLRSRPFPEEVYICCWAPQETLIYYGQRKLINIKIGYELPLNKPHFFIIPTQYLNQFLVDAPRYQTAPIIFNGKFLTLLKVEYF